jgi:uncharacterized membrane protein
LAHFIFDAVIIIILIVIVYFLYLVTRSFLIKPKNYKEQAMDKKIEEIIKERSSQKKDK